jgi:hypothetical protein
MAALLLQAIAARAAQLDKESCAKLKTEQAQLEQGGTRGSLGKGPEWAKVNLAPEKLEQVRRLIEVDEQLLFRCGGRPLVLLPSDPDPAARGETEGKDGSKAPAAKGAKAPAPDKKPPAAEKKAPDAEKKKTVPQKKAAPPPIGPAVLESAKAVAPPPVPPEAAPTPQAAPAPTNEVAKATPPAVIVPPPAILAPAAVSSPPAESAKEAEEKKAAALKAAKAKAKKKADDAYRPSAPDWTTNPFAGLLAPAPAPAKK